MSVALDRVQQDQTIRLLSVNRRLQITIDGLTIRNATMAKELTAAHKEISDQRDTIATMIAHVTTAIENLRAYEQGVFDGER